MAGTPSNSSSSPPSSPSLLSLYAFNRLTDLQHAQKCAKSFCRFEDCAATKLLLRHVGSCEKKQCKYKDCCLARIVLEHSTNSHTNERECPLCRKNTLVTQIHPRKLSRPLEYEMQRGEEIVHISDDEEKTDSTALIRFERRNKQWTKGVKSSYELREEEAYRLRFEQWHKQWKKEEKLSDETIFMKALPFILESMMLDNRESVYSSNNWRPTMHSLSLVNSSTYRFFLNPRNLIGRYEKATCGSLSIMQLSDGSLCFDLSRTWEPRLKWDRFEWFAPRSRDDEPDKEWTRKAESLFHIRGGPSEIVHYYRYSEYRQPELIKAIQKEFAVTLDDSREAIAVTEEIFDELALALAKYDFDGLILHSVIIDDVFLDFFLNRITFIDPHPRKIRYKNVMIAEGTSEKKLKDFSDTLEVIWSEHECTRGSSCKTPPTRGRRCDGCKECERKECSRGCPEDLFPVVDDPIEF